MHQPMLNFMRGNDALLNHHWGDGHYSYSCHFDNGGCLQNYFEIREGYLYFRLLYLNVKTKGTKLNYTKPQINMLNLKKFKLTIKTQDALIDMILTE